MSTPRPRRPQVPMAQRREELTEAALRVMGRDGVSALTTRAVAVEAGVPHGSVHYAFSGKHGLLKATIAADSDSAVRLFESVATQDATPAEVLERAFREYTDRVVADPETELVQQELTLMAVRDSSLGALVAEATTVYRESLGRLLTGLADQTDQTWDAPVPIIVEQLLGLLFGITVMWLLDRDETLLRASLADAARATANRLT